MVMLVEMETIEDDNGVDGDAGGDEDHDRMRVIQILEDGIAGEEAASLIFWDDKEIFADFWVEDSFHWVWG